MRGAFIASLLLILFTPACSATSPIIPVVTVTLQPSTVNITSSPTERSSADFNGNVTLDKLPLERIVVSLSPSVDKGWASSCTPASMVITDEDPHPFICTVVVPENQSDTTGTLIIEAAARGGGFSVTTSASAVIIVKGVAPANGTGDNRTRTASTGSTGPTGDKWDFEHYSPYLMPVVLGAVVAAAGSGAYAVYRRRKARLQGSE